MLKSHQLNNFNCLLPDWLIIHRTRNQCHFLVLHLEAFCQLATLNQFQHVACGVLRTDFPCSFQAISLLCPFKKLMPARDIEQFQHVACGFFKIDLSCSPSKFNQNKNATYAFISMDTWFILHMIHCCNGAIAKSDTCIFFFFSLRR